MLVPTDALLESKSLSFDIMILLMLQFVLIVSWASCNHIKCMDQSEWCYFMRMIVLFSDLSWEMNTVDNAKLFLELGF